MKHRQGRRGPPTPTTHPLGMLPYTEEVGVSNCVKSGRRLVPVSVSFVLLRTTSWDLTSVCTSFSSPTRMKPHGLFVTETGPQRRTDRQSRRETIP